MVGDPASAAINNHRRTIPFHPSQSIDSFYILLFLLAASLAHFRKWLTCYTSLQIFEHPIQDMLKTLRELSGSPGYCVEIGIGSWDSLTKPMLEQSAIACEKVKNMNDLRDGYNIVGLSQGNLIARGIIEFCDDAPLVKTRYILLLNSRTLDTVKNLISLGGPHAGIASFPFCGHKIVCTIVDFILRMGIYTPWLTYLVFLLNVLVQRILGPSGYVKIPTDIADYRKGCEFLPKLNNEIADERNSTYKQRFASLENLVLIMFTKEEILVPKETALFGYYPDGALHPVLPMQQTKLYIEDWIGLRTLDEAGKVKLVNVSGGHLIMSRRDIETYVVPYLKH
ncbi:unnamed protein product [Sphenostylis stenocarpa]|uniref:Palmitoyl-protein thioesterase 1 n=1 Tax=Sphenostylis stenocarpa TaxID=92480 RepID=A0AA86S0F7_9FABA|nr:unnamed protein product [Sphenostylis stenocarpa]